MVSYAAGRFRSKQVTSCCFKKIQHGFVLPHRRVRDVNHDLSAFKRLRQALTCKCVDARGWGCRNHLLAALAKVAYQFCSDEAGASDDHDFHSHSPWSLGPMNAASSVR